MLFKMQTKPDRRVVGLVMHVAKMVNLYLYKRKKICNFFAYRLYKRVEILL